MGYEHVALFFGQFVERVVQGLHQRGSRTYSASGPASAGGSAKVQPGVLRVIVPVRIPERSSSLRFRNLVDDAVARDLVEPCARVFD